MSRSDFVSRVFGSSSVALTGTTHATLVAAPPEGVAYRIFRVMGLNDTGGNRTMTLHMNKATVVTPIYIGSVVPGAGIFTSGAGESREFCIHLADTDESLEIDLDDTGTDVIYAFYEVQES